jgi:hypothetical protein
MLRLCIRGLEGRLYFSRRVSANGCVTRSGRTLEWDVSSV